MNMNARSRKRPGVFVQKCRPECSERLRKGVFPRGWRIISHQAPACCRILRSADALLDLERCTGMLYFFASLSALLTMA